MAGSQVGVITLSLLLVLLPASSCVGREFVVGGSGGWVERSHHESFNDWAKRQRFQVNDTLEFKYNKKADGVLLVNEAQYKACDTSHPFLRLDGGDYRFVLNKPGPYYFIDAESDRCRLGERLKIVVERSHNSTSSSPVAPPPTQTPPPPKSAPSPPRPSSPSAPNVLSPSIATVPATSGTVPPSKSSAVALSTGFLACLIVAGAAFLY